MVGLTGEHLIDDLFLPRRRPEQDAATVMGQIRRKVLHKHKLDICLRDLKPDNLSFLRSQPIEHNTLKFIDSGLSCRRGPAEVLNEVVSTTSYATSLVVDWSCVEQCGPWISITITMSATASMEAPLEVVNEL